MSLDVHEWYDEDEGKYNLTISWDENDPVYSQFSCSATLHGWTKDDFLTAIRNACDQEIPVGGSLSAKDCF